ncbi:MAG: universal stress protein [Bacteroidales bacterium]|nr:universal stress protein [Bacteroidales bacterium]
MDAKMNNVLLAPTDFSEVCANAIKQAAGTAKYLNFKLCILHVIDKITKADLKKKNLGEEYIIEKLNNIADEIIKEYNIEVETIAREGNIFTTISDVSKDIGAYFIYLGTHGKIGMQKVTGSFALKVVTSSNVPVIIVQKRIFEKGYNNIVLPITSDWGPWEKTKWAALIAQKFNAKINIFQLEGEKIDDAVLLITEHFKANDIDFSIKIAEKTTNFSKQVIDYATSINSEMIMIMTNPDKSLKKYILGSYDEDMIFNTSQIPVMCINPRDVNWKKIISR